MKKGLALFDFDGTVTTKDTLFELIKFQKGKAAFYLGMMRMSPVLIFYKLKLVSGTRAKEQVLSFFFANQSRIVFQKACDEFATRALPSLLRSNALEKMNEHIKKGDRVIIVSASAENWIDGWSRSMNIELIATRLEFKDNILTGKLASLNCNGDEKVRRIQEHVNITEYAPVYAYGNSLGDKAMLALADKPFYRKF